MNFPGCYSGYITRDGTFIEVPETNEASDHMVWCDQHHLCEEELMDCRGYIKLTHCLYKRYLYHYALSMSPEQIRTLEELGYEVEEYDRL